MTKDASIRRRVLLGSASNYAGRVASLVTWLLLTPFLLRQLGDTGYGLWILVGSVVAYGRLLNLGIPNTIVKYVAEHVARGEADEAHHLIATALRLYTGLGLVAVLLSAALAPLFPELFNVPPEERATASLLVLLMGATVGVALPCSTAPAVLQGLHRYDLVNLVNVLGTLLTAAAIVVVLLLGGGLVGMVAVNIPVALAMQALSLRYVHRIAPELRFGWRGARRRSVGTITSFSWPVLVNGAAEFLQRRTDEIVIGAVLPLSAVTPYSLARRLAELPANLTRPFARVLLPLASELHAEDDAIRLRELYIAGTRVTLAICSALAYLVVTLAQPILTLWVGARYAEVGYLVAILGLAGLLRTGLRPGNTVLQGMARHRPLALVALGSGLANLLLSAALVQPFGLTGVALGTLIPTVIESLGLVLPYTLRATGVGAGEGIRRIFLPALLPVVPMAILIATMDRLVEVSSVPALAIVAAAGVAVYAAAYLAVGASDVERQTCRDLAASMVRLGEARLKWF